MKFQHELPLIIILIFSFAGCATVQDQKPALVDLSNKNIVFSDSEIKQIIQEGNRIQKEPIRFIQIQDRDKVDLATGGHFGGLSYTLYKRDGHWQYVSDGSPSFWNQ